MAVFAYTALVTDGSIIHGTIAADTARLARDQLRSRGYVVQQIEDHQAAERIGRIRWRWAGRHASKVTTSIHELATLLGAGIPLLEGLDTQIRQHRGAFRVILQQLREKVAAGSSLAEAMAEQPVIFDPLCVHMVEVGESAGNLERVLEKVADFRERFQQLKDRVLTALIYPIFLIAFGIIASIFLMTFVMPMLLESLLETKRALPWPTQVVKGMSDILVNHGWWILLVVVASTVFIISAFRKPKGQRVWYRWLGRIPVLGEIARKQAISRMAMIVATLLRSGVVFTRALDLAGRSTKNVILREALERACERIGAGRDLGAAFEEATEFPPLVIQIFSVGQASGKLEGMLERLAEDYDRQVAVATARFTAALEPILILLLAVFVGFLLLATMLPILEAGNVL